MQNNQLFEPHAKLDSMIWGGFSNHAAKRLYGLLANGSQEEMYQASWGLARMLVARGETEEGHSYLQRANDISPANAGLITTKLFEIEVLRRLGRTDDAINLGLSTHRKFGDEYRLCYMMSALYTDVAVRLDWLNRPVTTAGYAPYRVIRPAEPLSIFNVAADADFVTEPQKVSVIMPSFNSSATIAMAAGSILGQTWRNIELIIVDDCSTDDSWDIVQGIAATDERVKAIRQHTNSGVYKARNAGLRAATGDYITVNDSDDWSHPQRIEAQVRDLLSKASRKLNTTFGIRATEDLIPAVRPRSGGFVTENTSALLVKRDVVVSLGGWDETRFSADSELYFRLQKQLRVKERHLHKRACLSFILSRPESLTNNGATSLSSLQYGARREYREASNYWRARTKDMTIDPAKRHFPLPRITLDKTSTPIFVDWLLIGDMCTEDSISRVKTAMERGGFAIFHIPAEANFGKDFHPEIRGLVHDHWLTVVVPGETVIASNIDRPDTIDILPDLMPNIAKSVDLSKNATLLETHDRPAQIVVPTLESLPSTPFREAVASKFSAADEYEAEIRRLEAQRAGKKLLASAF